MSQNPFGGVTAVDDAAMREIVRAALAGPTLVEQYADMVMNGDLLRKWNRESVGGVAEWFAEAGLTQAAAFVTAYVQCPSGHREAVPVEDLDGETVAALCPDCDRQLPPEWARPPEPGRDFEAEHKADHHGYPSAFLLACRLCAEECNPDLVTEPPVAPPFTPDPRLTARIKE